MIQKYDKLIQVLVQQDTIEKLDALIMMDALHKGTPIPTRSKWLRDLIEDTLAFEINKKMIEEWRPEMIRHIKPKK